MGVYTETKRGLLEALLVLVDQKIAYYERERCCDEEAEEAERERVLVEWRDGRGRIAALAADDARLADAPGGPVAEGSLVRLAVGRDEAQFVTALVVPHAAGQTLTLGQERCLTVSGDSELGAAIVGRRAGERFSLRREDRDVPVRIDAVDGGTA